MYSPALSLVLYVRNMDMMQFYQRFTYEISNSVHKKIWPKWEKQELTDGNIQGSALTDKRTLKLQLTPHIFIHTQKY